MPIFYTDEEALEEAKRRVNAEIEFLNNKYFNWYEDFPLDDFDLKIAVILRDRQRR